MTITVSAPTPKLRRKAGARPLITLAAAAFMLVGSQSPAQAQSTPCDGSLQGFFGCLAVGLGLIKFNDTELARMWEERERNEQLSGSGNSRFETGLTLASPMPTNDPIELCWGGSYIPRSQCPPHP